MRTRPVLTLLLTLAVGLSATVQARTPATDSTTKRTTKPLPLDQLVRDALQNNLPLQAARSATRGVETGIEAARSVFDPLLDVSTFYERGDRDLLLEPGNAASGTQTGRGVDGRIFFVSRLLVCQMPVSTS